MAVSACSFSFPSLFLQTWLVILLQGTSVLCGGSGIVAEITQTAWTFSWETRLGWSLHSYLLHKTKCWHLHFSYSDPALIQNNK